ncbi:Tyrosine-protein kinase RYK [Schistosoma japonicum]|uniref:Tyrosine-protein kinase RYK n=1 Tax=Schistosoma japonicum TaxID=6182 RepID=A0A4Z2CVB7_SCHJA|nr:Tyrosine-protein kinase RYK [Schistosoma japonicum]
MYYSMENPLLIICLIIFIGTCILLIILHQRKSTSKQSYQHNKNLRYLHFNSLTTFNKCITLCNKLCNTTKTTHVHDFKAKDINVNHKEDVNKTNNLMTDYKSYSIKIDSDLYRNNIIHETIKSNANHQIMLNSFYQNYINSYGKYSQSSMTIHNELISDGLMKSNRNWFLHYKTSDSSFSCQHLNKFSDPFNTTDNESSNVNSLLDTIQQNRKHLKHNLKRLNYKNSYNKILAMKYKNYLHRIKQTSKSNGFHLKLHSNNNVKTIERDQNRELVNLESPWVKANNTLCCDSSNTCQSNQSSCSSYQDDILISVCPKARDPTNILADMHVPLHKIILNSVILQGTFSQLYEGKLLISFRRHGIYTSKWKQVLIKTLTEKATEEQVRIFKNDACKFVGAKHSQIASIIAASSTSICTYSQSNHQTISRPILIYSDAKYGNLKLFLQRRSNGVDDRKIRPNMILTAAQLINMGLQILSAVDYLHSINLIHEDIATRNCVLKCRTRVSLSDSALSRDLFPEDYHCLGDNTNRPVKWLALEALIERKYSMATDVWSVGITLWELITRGQQPYAHIDAFEITNVLRTGYRLKKPHNCPDELWKIIFACWRADPSARPTIHQLITKLKAFKVEVTNYI